jgi:hypothetical protein
MKTAVCKALFAIMVCAGFVAGQDDVLEQYAPGTIPAMTAKFVAKTKKSADEVFVTESYMIKTTLVYSGSSRKVSDKKSGFLAKWLKENQYPEDMIPTTEYEFNEGNSKYWLVLQNIVAPHFVQEIKPGSTVDLYLFLLGSLKENGSSGFVILINEYKRPEDSGPSGPRTGKPKVWGEEGALQDYERYVVRTLREIIARHLDSEATKGANVLLTGDTFPSRVRATYTGSTRKVPALRKQHLEMLAQSFNVDPKVIAKYETEMLFKEGNDEHWLPVVKDLIPFFEKEMTKGETVILYTEWVGARKINDKWEWIFLVQEFQKPLKPPITEAP